MRTFFLLTLAACCGALVPQLLGTGALGRSGLARSQDFARLSPFTGLRFAGEDCEVQVDERWYRLLSIEGLEASRIRRFCQERYGALSEKRFAEDLVEVLAGLGKPDRVRVDLELVDLESGERRSLRGLEMTHEKRQRLWAARRATERARPEGALSRVERAHASRVPEELRELSRPWPIPDRAGVRLPRAALEADLDQLEWALEHEHAYRELRGIDARAAFDAVRAGLPGELSLAAFALQVQRLVALLGDAHAGLAELEAQLPPGWLPFLLADARGGLVAFRPDRSALLDPERPFVQRLDGRPLEAWLAPAAELVPAGSRSSVRFRALRHLRHWAFVRAALGLEPASEVELELVDARGERARTLRLPLAAEKPVYGPWPRRASGMLAHGIGYLRIADMPGRPGELERLERELATLAGSRALIVDLRGNGGGTRDALHALVPLLLPRASGPLVVNVAAPRLGPGESSASASAALADRFLFPRDSPRFGPSERALIDALAARFAPDWPLPREGFGPWHYCLLSPAAQGGDRLRGIPVAVLHDQATFSAAEILLGALAELPQTITLGSASGGGSGRARTRRLAHSGLQVRLASMASFRPSGARYDGLGIEPDHEVLPAPEDLLSGGSDAVLERALELLRAERRR